ncbi:MAG: hypothetical protein AB7D43_05935 [Sulfurimonadaceae bacterium]
MIDFREFNKDELVMACNELLEHNMLGGMELYLVKKLNSAKYNRLAREFNKKAEEYNASSAKDERHKLYTRAMIAKTELDKHIEKMKKLNMLTEEEANELTA